MKYFYSNLYYEDENFITCLGPIDKDIKEAILHPNTKVIAHEAFSNTNIESLIPSPVLEVIEDYAFFKCTKLRKILFPTTLKEIGSNAFSFTYIDNIDLSNTVCVFSETAFECANVKFFHYPAIEDFIPNIPESLIGLDLENSKIKKLTEINCHKLQFILLPPTLKEIDSYCFCYTKLEEIILPPGLKCIKEGAFANTDIKRLTLPEGLAYIEDILFKSNIKQIFFDSQMISKSVLERLQEIKVGKNVEIIDLNFEELIKNKSFKEINKILKNF